MGKRFLKQFEILMKKAIVDFNSAKVLLKAFEKGDVILDLETIYFHLQQSSEKLFKVLLDFNNVKFPHTHDLSVLHNLLRTNDIEIPLNSEELIILSSYAVEGRYSVIHDDLNDADKYILIIEKLINFVNKEITI